MRGFLEAIQPAGHVGSLQLFFAKQLTFHWRHRPREGLFFPLLLQFFVELQHHHPGLLHEGLHFSQVSLLHKPLIQVGLHSQAMEDVLLSGIHHLVLATPCVPSVIVLWGSQR